MNNILSYKDKRILAAYQLFYGEKYGGIAGGENLLLHLKAQKMVYFLSNAGIYMGEYGFLWNTKGPYSSALQVDLKRYDHNSELVSKFYTEGKEIFDGKTKKEINHIKTIVLRQKPKDCEAVAWIELVGSLCFIWKAVMPYSSDEKIHEEAIKRNPELRSIVPDMTDAFETMRKVKSIF